MFIQAMRKIGQLRDPRCFAGWLRSMASRMALNRALRHPPMPVMSEKMEVPCPVERSPLGDILDEEPGPGPLGLGPAVDAGP